MEPFTRIVKGRWYILRQPPTRRTCTLVPRATASVSRSATSPTLLVTSGASLQVLTSVIIALISWVLATLPRLLPPPPPLLLPQASKPVQSRDAGTGRPLPSWGAWSGGRATPWASGICSGARPSWEPPRWSTWVTSTRTGTRSPPPGTMATPLSGSRLWRCSTTQYLVMDVELN